MCRIGMVRWAALLGNRVRGDPNFDGSATSADVTIALRIAAGGSDLYGATMLAAADASGDGKVTSLDALMIMQVAAGRISL